MPPRRRRSRTSWRSTLPHAPAQPKFWRRRPLF
jgi:hypothetical protein